MIGAPGRRKIWTAVLAWAALAGALSIAATALADPHQVRPGDITIASRIVRASIPGSPNSAAYMVIANSGAQADALVAARCACAASVDIHKSTIMRGVSMMTTAAPVAIPAHGKVEFQPNGYHLM